MSAWRRSTTRSACPTISPPATRTQFRAMPTVGLEYRYPFIGVQSWGTQTIEPIAQVIVRPNETANRQAAQRRLAKPDLRRHQSVPGRQVRRLGPHRRRRPRQRRHAIHHAVQPRRLRQRPVRPVLSPVRRQLVRGRATTPTPASTAASTPTDPTTWPACRISRTASTSFTTRFRFDQDNFEVRRFETEARASFDRWSVALLYGKYDAQPQLGFLERREGILGSGSIKLTQNWMANAAVRYDVDAHKFAGTSFGIGYIDDCLIVALNYITELYLQRRCDPGRPDHAANDAPHARRHVGQPDCQQRSGGVIVTSREPARPLRGMTAKQVRRQNAMPDAMKFKPDLKPQAAFPSALRGLAAAVGLALAVVASAPQGASAQGRRRSGQRRSDHQFRHRTAQQASSRSARKRRRRVRRSSRS